MTGDVIASLSRKESFSVFQSASTTLKLSRPSIVQDNNEEKQVYQEQKRREVQQYVWL